MNLPEFFKSKFFYRNLLLSIAAFIFLILFTVLILNLFTRHGSEKPLPSLIGLNIIEAQVLLEDLDYRYEVTDSVFMLKMAPGRIYDQNPVAGSMVKGNRKIRLSIYSTTPVMAAVPDVIDQSIRNAEGELLESGFVIERITYVPSDFTNLVLQQKYKGATIASGVKLPKGSAIELVVGRSGAGDVTKVPDLSGLSLGEAKAYAQSVQINIGNVLDDGTVKSDADSLKAVVFKQSPRASEQATVRLGSVVDIWITTDYTKIELQE